MRNQISFHTSRIIDFRMHGIRNSRNGRIAVTSFTVGGQNVIPTRSFWHWLLAEFLDQSDRATNRKSTAVDVAQFFARLQAEQPNAQIEYEIRWEDGIAMLRAPFERVLHAARPTCNPHPRIARIAPLLQRSIDEFFMPRLPGMPRFSRN